MLDYNEYKRELILENAINEGLLAFNSTFLRNINNIDSPISDRIRKSNFTDIKPNVTLVDYDKDGLLSYTTDEKIKRDLEAEGVGINQQNKLSWYKTISGYDFDLSKNRNNIKIGKFINKVYKDEFTDKQIEDFVNSIKSIYENENEEFLFYEGDKIKEGYNSDNYYKNMGQLGQSCMNDKNILEMYEKNPEVCRLLVLELDNKILGRALVWKVSYIDNEKSDYYFMDRIYTSNDYDIKKFENYAKKEGWLYKVDNSLDSIKKVYKDGQSVELDLKIVLKKIDYDKFPYMDTFKVFNSYNYTLLNESEEWDWLDDFHYVLEETNGGYKMGNSIWSEWYEEYIPEDGAVYSEFYDSYIKPEDAVNINGKWYPKDSEQIVYSEKQEIYLKKRYAIFSDYYNSYIDLGLSEKAYISINKIDNVFEDDKDFVKNEYESFINRSAYLIHKDKVIKDYLFRNIIKDVHVKAYKHKKDDYLTKRDAKELGLSIKEDEANSRIYHIVEYFKNFKHEQTDDMTQFKYKIDFYVIKKMQI
jgi:hypothetical protein